MSLARCQENGPVNWYGGPLDRRSVPIRYDWRCPALRKYVNESVRALGGMINREHIFDMIRILTSYWRAPIGSARAKPMSFVERRFQEQYTYRESHRLYGWMRRTIEDEQREFRMKLTPPRVNQICRPEARITMGSDMPPETTYNIVERLGNHLAQDWEAARRMIECKNREPWFDACGLWKREATSTSSEGEHVHDVITPTLED